MCFADKLTELRSARGLSQEQLAEAIGVTRQAVSRWERGANLPDAVSLTRLAGLFGVTAEWLVDEEAEPGDGRARLRSRFWILDRAFLALGALLLAVRAVNYVLSKNGTFFAWLMSADTYFPYMAYAHVNWLLLTPGLCFSAGWLASALACMWLGLPDARVQRAMKYAGLALLALFAALAATDILAVLGVLDDTPVVVRLANFVIRSPWLTLPAGLALSLSYIRPARR